MLIAHDSFTSKALSNPVHATSPVNPIAPIKNPEPTPPPAATDAAPQMHGASTDMIRERQKEAAKNNIVTTLQQNFELAETAKYHFTDPKGEFPIALTQYHTNKTEDNKKNLINMYIKYAYFSKRAIAAFTNGLATLKTVDTQGTTLQAWTQKLAIYMGLETTAGSLAFLIKAAGDALIKEGITPPPPSQF